MNAHAVLKFTRKVHLYLGIFATPALLFFAFTGAMQTVNLHEAGRGSDYKPPAWISTLAQLHKKQTTEVPVRKAAGQRVSEPASQRERPAEAKAPGQAPVQQKSHWPMKIFFLLISVSLALSTLTGVYMTYKYDRGWWLLTGLLVAGVVVPVCLLPF